MVNSLILSFLPHSIIYNKAVQFLLKHSSSAPTAKMINEALLSAPKSKITEQKFWFEVEKITPAVHQTCELLIKSKIKYTDFWSLNYPEALKTLDYPPWNLFYLGTLPQQVPTLAVVGTRKPNKYGIEVIEKILLNLRTNPLQIISGFAYGVDSLTHHFACELNIPNFAVMGCGLDMLYPVDHIELSQRILNSQGGLLSEYPPGTLPLPRHFPWRNRIISALSDVVWIPQGANKSGSLHTAKHALEQGRTIAITPGDIFSELSELPNRLLFEGGQPILCAKDLDQLLYSDEFRVTH